MKGNQKKLQKYTSWQDILHRPVATGEYTGTDSLKHLTYPLPNSIYRAPIYTALALYWKLCKEVQEINTFYLYMCLSETKPSISIIL